MPRFEQISRATGLLRFALPCGLGMLFAASICVHGIPALRHDWWWPVTRYGFYDSLINFTSGWLPNGIGAPTTLPGDYMAGSIIAAVGLVAGPLPTLALYSFAMGLLCAASAASLARGLGADPVRAAAVQIFAVFNPWVYNETVAGHIFMILAYGALLGIVAEGTKRKPNAIAIALLALLTVSQIQFFIITVLTLLLIAVARKVYFPLVTAFVAAIPLVAGYTMERVQLLHTPYTVAWQKAQSVSVTKGFVLLGYFTQYASRGAGWQTPALWMIVALCVCALVLGRRRLVAYIAAATAALSIFIASGVRGPLAVPYGWAVQHVAQTAVYRELYDLLGVAAIAYVALLAMPLRRFSSATTALAVAAAVWVSTLWLFAAPSSYWVNSAAMPIITFAAPSNTRFALMPPFQPMSFEGQGSGADRDTYRRPGNVTPLNEYLSIYPADAALSMYMESHDVSALTALSVSTIVDRPWLRSDTASLKFQLSSLPSAMQSRRHALTVTHLRALPEVTIGPLPAPAALGNALGSGNILFADARSVRGAGVPSSWARFPPLKEIRVPNVDVDAAAGWVSAQFAFTADPHAAQGIGGAVTTNPSAPLPVRGGYDTLVSIRGTLRGVPGTAAWKSTRGYTWIHLPRAVSALYCEGRCFVAAQVAKVPSLPLNPPARPSRALAFHAVFPFFIRAHVPAGQSGLLRYNVRYDSQWAAYVAGHVLPHARIDGTVNGWIVPPARAERTLILVERTAFVQFLAECFAMLWALAALGLYLARALRARETTLS